jgi:hypothetical protein
MINMGAAHWWRVVALLAALVTAPCRGDDDGPATFTSFLTGNEIDQSNREAMASATEWSDAVEAVAVKVLRRLDAPASLVAGWESVPAPSPAKGDKVAVSDTLYAIRGRATFVAPQRLSGELAERYGGPAYDVVRIVAEGGLVVDVLTRTAPAAWPRWKVIDEPASAVGLPLSTAATPRPKAPPSDGQEWPAEPPALVVASVRVGWHPDTPLGRLGMDYGLFDSVVDGKKLVKGDAAAFYATLAAAGKTTWREVAKDAGQPIDAMLLIDPGRKWFPSHRGDPVVIEGNAMKATRVTIDEAYLRKFVGSDHYWEVFVFVETPLLDVNRRMQNTYPIVCCVRELPPGMPSGDRISERVRVAGFALKRYAYPFDDPRPDASGEAPEGPSKRLTTLLIAPQLEWFPPASQDATQPIWVIAAVAALVALAAIVGVGVLYGNRSLDRTIRKAREELPDRVDIPSEDR